MPSAMTTTAPTMPRMRPLGTPLRRAASTADGDRVAGLLGAASYTPLGVAVRSFSADSISAGVWKRRSGSLAMARAMMASSQGGTSGRTSRMGVGSLSICWRSTAQGFSASKGGLPVSIS